MRLGVSDHLLCRGSRIGHSLHGFPPSTVGMGPGVSDYLLCRGSGIRANVVSLVLSSSDMFIGGSLGQSQHLKGLTLGVRIGKDRRLVQDLVVTRCSTEQPFDTALHPTISHGTTSVLSDHAVRPPPARLPVSKDGRAGAAASYQAEPRSFEWRSPTRSIDHGEC